jgi:hypothetical protein
LDGSLGADVLAPNTVFVDEAGDGVFRENGVVSDEGASSTGSIISAGRIQTEDLS